MLGPRRRPRHPRGNPRQIRHPSDRTRPHQPARRREIRPGRLQIFGRAARRRGEVRQCALRLVQGGGTARRQSLRDFLRAWESDRAADGGRPTRQPGRNRHADHVFPGRHHLHHHDRVQIRPPHQAPSRTRVPQPRACHHAHRRARRQAAHRDVPLQTGDHRVRAPARGEQGRCFTPIRSCCEGSAW